MPTIDASSIINRAARGIGLLGLGQTLSGEDTAACLEALNDMLDSWNNEGLTVYEVRDEQFTLPQAVSSRTIGTGGDFSTARPANLEWVFIRESGSDYTLTRMSSRQWAELPSKSIAGGWPAMWYYVQSAPLGTLYFDTVTSQAFELHLGTWRQFSAFATASATADMPHGFKEALTYNLATRLAPEYGLPISGELDRFARTSLGNIKRMRIGAISVRSEVPYLTGGGSSNIIAGT